MTAANPGPLLDYRGGGRFALAPAGGEQLGNIFRNPDMSGFGKALWFLFVLFIPLIGVLVYLIAYGGTMNDRSVW